MMKKNLFSLLILAGIFTLAFAFTACGDNGGDGTPGPGDGDGDGSEPGTITLEYTVKFDGNGATGSTPPSKTVEPGETLVLPHGGTLNKGTDTFGGWNTEDDGSGANFSAGFVYPVIKNTTFYANWLAAAETCVVSFSGNGGSGTAPVSLTVALDSFITLPGKGGLSHGDKMFGGWAEDAAGGGEILSAGSFFRVEDDITFYAIWTGEDEMCTVTFDKNEEQANVPEPMNVSKGSIITLPGVSNITSTSINFDGWNTRANGSGDKYLVGEFLQVDDDLTLYAMWKDSSGLASLYGIVRFNANGGAGTVPAQQFGSAGDIITLPGKGGLSPPELGKTFDGWNTRADGTGDSYGEGDLFVVRAGTTNLHAVWVFPGAVVPVMPIFRVVSFNANGGVGTPPAAISGQINSEITLPARGDLRSGASGYVFNGWDTQADGKGTRYAAGAKYKITGNAVLYAHWLRIPRS